MTRTPTDLTDAVANDVLAHEFPDIPLRILAAVLASYLPLARNLNEAIAAVRARIADACAH